MSVIGASVDVSSSSSETSLGAGGGAGGRRGFPSRRGQGGTKGAPGGSGGPGGVRRHVRSSSGYSSHNDETTFRWVASAENDHNCNVLLPLRALLLFFKFYKLWERCNGAISGMPLARILHVSVQNNHGIKVIKSYLFRLLFPYFFYNERDLKILHLR